MLDPTRRNLFHHHPPSAPLPLTRGKHQVRAARDVHQHQLGGVPRGGAGLGDAPGQLNLGPRGQEHALVGVVLFGLNGGASGHDD